MILSFLVAFLVLLLDQWTKALTIKHIPLHTSKPGVDGIFDFYHIRNTGASWGIFQGRMSLFYIITIVAVVYLCYLICQKRQSPWWFRIGLGLLLGGALGNFIDRLRNKYVTDMIRLTFIDFPIFNVADMALTIGVVILMIAIILEPSEGEV